MISKNIKLSFYTPNHNNSSRRAYLVVWMQWILWVSAVNHDNLQLNLPRFLSNFPALFIAPWRSCSCLPPWCCSCCDTSSRRCRDGRRWTLCTLSCSCHPRTKSCSPEWWSGGSGGNWNALLRHNSNNVTSYKVVVLFSLNKGLFGRNFYINRSLLDFLLILRRV